jgi:hypothetical protein
MARAMLPAQESSLEISFLKAIFLVGATNSNILGSKFQNTSVSPIPSTPIFFLYQ